MARFYGSMTGQAKTEATRRGGSKSGVQAHIRGWDTGLRIAAHAENFSDEGDDTFNVVITGGSNGARHAVGLAEIVQCRDGSVRVRLDERFGGGLYDLSTGLIEKGEQ